MNSKQKGGAFERLTCHKLSLWVSGGKHDDLFWRSSMSGGRATVRFNKGVETYVVGDICAVRAEGLPFTDRYLIECKHYKKLDLHLIIFAKGKLVRFWLDAVKSAAQHRRRPLLIAKENQRPTIVLAWAGEFGKPITSFVLSNTRVVTDVYYLDDIIERRCPV